MSQELSAQLNLSFRKNGFTLSKQFNRTRDVSGAQAIDNVQSVGTTTEAILTGDAAGGVLFVQNLDPTNYVEISVDNANATPIARLLPGPAAGTPGDFVFLPMANGATYYATAHTGACDCVAVVIDA